MPGDSADFIGIDCQDRELIEVEARGYRASQPIDCGNFFYPSHILQVFLDVERTAAWPIRYSRYSDVATGFVEHLISGATFQRSGEAGGEYAKAGGQY